MKIMKIPFIKDLNPAVTNIKDLFGVDVNPYNLINRQGVHHSCYYDIIIPVPEMVVKMLHAKHNTKISGSALAERLNHFCVEAVTAPGTILSTSIRVGGEAIEIPYDRQYDSFQTTFYVEGGYEDNGGMTYNVFQAWLDTIYPPITRNFAYPDEYTTTVKLALYTTPDANPLFGKEHIVIVNYMECWPASIQSITATGRSGSTPTEFTVTWKYRYCITGPLDQDQSALNSIADLVKNGFRVYRSANNWYKDAKKTYSSLKDAWKSIKDWF